MNTQVFEGEDASKFADAYLQMNMYLTRLVCYTDSGVQYNMGAPGDAVRQVLGRLGCIAVSRGQEGRRSSAAAGEEELAADGVVDVQYSRVVVVGGGGKGDPAARGGDDAA
jgi:hypothetical protein